MADSEPTHDNPRNTRNLPAVVPQGEVTRPTADNWLTRAIRVLFGWKPGSVRDDLQVVLDASTPDDAGFSAIERTMLRNILGLHERRIADVMIHRADIIAVKRDIPVGELMSLFESAAHSRLVVYNETLDDPEGIVHIRDLLAFMTAKARALDPGKSKRKKPFPAGLDLRAVDLAQPLSDANNNRKMLFVTPSMRANVHGRMRCAAVACRVSLFQFLNCPATIARAITCKTSRCFRSSSQARTMGRSSRHASTASSTEPAIGGSK